MLTYVKEYENYLLSENKDEALMSVVPGSEADIYLKLVNQLKVIQNLDENAKIPEEVWKILENAAYKLEPNTLRDTKLVVLLKEFDLKLTNTERKKAIITEIKEMFYNHLNFNYPKPPNVQDNNNMTEESSQTEKNKDKLDDSIFDLNKVVEKYLQRPDDIQPLLQINENYFLQYVDITKMPDKFYEHWITRKNFNFPLSQASDKVITTLADYVNKFSDRDKCSPDIQDIVRTMTVRQVEKLMENIHSVYFDINELYNSIITKEYYSKFASCSDDREKREVYVKIYELIFNLPSKFNALKANVLREILSIGKDYNIYDLELFKQYLANPCSADDQVFIMEKKKRKEISKQRRYNISGINYSTAREDTIVSSYLRHFFLFKNLKMEEFEEFITYEVLKREFSNATLLKGQESDEIIKSLGKDQYESLVKYTEISICSHNKPYFQIDELVEIEVDLKNVQTLFVKIFEINSENYYYSKKVPINSNIMLEGLIATYEETYAYNEKPQKLVRRKYEFDKIPNKRGIYIIEFIGGGISSRAIIKKGGLSLVTRSTAKGKFLFILNEDSKVCKSEGTGVWFKDHFYPCEKDIGHIVIPYMKQTHTEPCILVHEGFAELANLQVTEEKYELKGVFHINHESIIMGNTAKVLFRPYLYINQRETKVDYLKNGKITAKLTKRENGERIPISSVFDKLSVNNEKEIEIDLQIPPKLETIELLFEADIYNRSKEKTEKLSTNYSINLISYHEDNQFAKFFLKKVDNSFFLSLLGKNGEPKIGQSIKLNFKLRNLGQPIEQHLITNSNGELELGNLENVTNFKAEVLFMGRNISYKWILPQLVSLSYPSSIDILEGQSFELPYKIQVKETDVSFLQVTQNGEVVHNLTQTLCQNSQASNLSFSGLGKGNYILYLKHSNTTININVHVGKIWETDNFIITKDKIIENSENRTPIYIKDISLKSNNESSSSTLKLALGTVSKNARVHLFTHHFLNNNVYSLSESVNQILSSASVHSEHSFQVWKNFYLSNRLLNDEAQYVFDRKYLERFLGNSLEKPSLLVKRQYLRDTNTQYETLAQGTEFENAEAEVIKATARDKRMLKGRQNEASGFYGTESTNNLFSDFQNFLTHAPLSILNVKPDINGEIEIKNFPLQKYSHVQIVAFDERSICEHLVSLDRKLLQKRNLTLMNSLNLDKTYSEIRNVEFFLKDKEVVIEDIASTSYKIIDSLEKIVGYQLLANSSLTSQWNKFSFILEFAELSEEEQKKKLSEFFSHELNIFLYFRYPSLYAKYVEPLIKYKSEKTFIDFFLLNDSHNLEKFTSPSRIEELNSFERCLLIKYLIQNNQHDLAKHNKNSLLTLVNKENYSPARMKVLFNIMMNMKADENELKFAEKAVVTVADQNFNFANTNMTGTHVNSRSNQGFANKFNAAQNFAFNEEEDDEQGFGDLCGGVEYKNMEMDVCYDDDDMLPEKCEEEEYSHFDRAENFKFSNQGFEDKKYANLNARNNLYKDAGKSKEYQETHYFERSVFNKFDITAFSLFWVDFANHLTSGHSSNFLSKNILIPAINVTELIFLLSVVDLPFKSQSHQFNRKEGMALQIVPSSNLIMFTREIKEAPAKLNSKIMIAQNVTELYQSNDNETAIKEYLTGKIYEHETIVTNISNIKINFELLIQIPEGAIPVQNSEYTRTIQLSLNKFSTTNYKTYFYFPEEAGVFKQYPPNATIDGVVISRGDMLTYEVVKSIRTQSKESFENILVSGSKADILEFLDNNAALAESHLNKIYWLLKDKEFYTKLIPILRKKEMYSPTVWSFALYHSDFDSLREYLELDPSIKRAVGPKFSSSLVKVGESFNADIMNHFDYYPIFNARVHKLGREAIGTILNNEFKETYQKFIVYLLKLRTEEIDAKCWIRLCYYLILQDRIEEALKVFSKIDTREFNENSSLAIQYDYIAAYLDFSIGYPDFKIAKEICQKYKHFPLLHWKELFEEIEDQMIEYEGKEVFGDIDSLIDEDKKKKQMAKKVIATQPTLSFALENKSLQIHHSNLSSIKIKFYLIDLEILFSRTPFIKSNTEDFSFVQPNFVQELKVNNSTKEELTIFPIPNEFLSKNIFIEVSSINKKAFETYFSTSLKVAISENLGEIKVTDNNLKPLPKVYVKCFAKMNDNSVKFYKDGYTDMRGKFNFILLNTGQLKNLTRFSIFILHDEFGSIIKECNPPANISKESSNNVTSDYENYQNYRQEVRQIWRTMNKK